MPDYPHKLLINPQGVVNHFDGTRGFEEKDDDEEEEQPDKNYERQKENLRQALVTFGQDNIEKYSQRILKPSYSIDYIRIDFLITFANTIEYKTKDIFEKHYGLHPIRFYNFNKSVLFEIADRAKFDVLQHLLQQFISSSENISPEGREYNIVTLIRSFRLLTARELYGEVAGNNLGSIALQLTHQVESVYREQKITLEKELIKFLNESKVIRPSLIYQFEDQLLLINGITTRELQLIVQNFDLFACAQSIRIPRILPNLHPSVARVYDFNIINVDLELPKILIIDTGISQSTPLNPLLRQPNYTFDALYPANRPEHHHGTAVALIAAVGEQFYNNNNRTLTAHCHLAAYRLFEDGGGSIDLISFERNIRDAAENGIRFFNLSINVHAKNYNGNYSFFAYLLDKLSHELHILFFISAGNLHSEDLNEIYERLQLPGYSAMLDYPAHFFSPEEFCLEHNCESTNLKEPAESLNNITVGALADNLNEHSQVDMSFDKITPAYYTSKYHVSPFHKVNGGWLKGKHINYRLYKPDIVFQGGDYGVESAGIQVLGTGYGIDQYRQECGTSFSTPFAANLAVRIAYKYPKINIQSIKALIINSASHTAPSSFLERHLNALKEKFSISEFGKTFSALNLSEKLKVNKWFHKEDMLHRLSGHGRPDIHKALSSDQKSITVILEDQIAINTHKAIPIHLPTYINAFPKTSTIIDIEATLCYAFMPDFNEQMGYNPLHISFNFIKTFETPTYTAKVAAYRADDIPDLNFYTPLYRGTTDSFEKNKRRKNKLGIKTNLETWSDDFYPNIRQFSNTQKLRLKININDLAKTNNEISLIVRCTGKSDAPYEVKNYLNGQHSFSMVLTFSEEGKKTFSDIDFYESFLEINQTANIISDLDSELEELDSEI